MVKLIELYNNRLVRLILGNILIVWLNFNFDRG